MHVHVHRAIYISNCTDILKYMSLYWHLLYMLLRCSYPLHSNPLIPFTLPHKCLCSRPIPFLLFQFWLTAKSLGNWFSNCFTLELTVDLFITKDNSQVTVMCSHTDNHYHETSLSCLSCFFWPTERQERRHTY